MIQNISSVRHFAVEIDVKTAAVNVTRLGFINCISRCNLLKNMIFLSSLVPFVQFLFYPMHLLDCNRLFPGFTTIQYSTIICSFLPSLTFYGGFFLLRNLLYCHTVNITLGLSIHYPASNDVHSFSIRVQ